MYWIIAPCSVNDIKILKSASRFHEIHKRVRNYSKLVVPHLFIQHEHILMVIKYCNKSLQ